MPRGNPFALQQLTILLVVLVSLTAQTAYSQKPIKSMDLNDNLSNVRITKNITSMPLAFTANQGQWDDKVKFRANAGGATMWFGPDGAYYQFSRRIETEDKAPYSIAEKRYGLMPDEMMDRQSYSVETMMIKATFVGANPNPQMTGVDMMEYKCNYFIGNDPNEWHTDVPNYSAVLYEEIYDGINLKYYGNGRQMEYDFIVSPGADYSQIMIQYEGAESISINTSGELVVTTKWGKVIEQRPVIYQIENNSRIAVTGEYKMMDDNSFGFELSSSYNPALPLVIDPLLSYSTYLGGSDTDAGYGIAVDGSGNAYITGSTVSADFPSEGEYQADQSGQDAFVTKLNPSGNALVYSTYLGGTSDEYGYRIAVDHSGNVYITGATISSDFPTKEEYQTYQGAVDGFVTKLNSTGDSLVYSTYLGGTSDEYVSGIAVDGSGNAYITGVTFSTDFPIEGAYQTYQGDWDAFVTKLNPAGSALVYSTYLGGSGLDFSGGIALDVSGNAYITGVTFSTDFPIEGAYQTYQGDWDAFVTKLNNSGDSLVFSTYLGGSSSDVGQDIAVDSTGNVYITGLTLSTDFPIEGAFQATPGGQDAFVTKLNSSGNALVYSTYLGGGGNDESFGITVDGSGNAYITGYTRSTDFPTEGTNQTYQGEQDAFVTKLDSSGSALAYSTYLGGGGRDNAWDIAVDGSGNAYLVGKTWSTDFPTEGEFQTFQGSSDVFVSKFTTNCCVGNRGDLNGDGDDANILDLTFAVDRIFRGGSASLCPEEGDANGDSDPTNILDLTFLVDRIFRGGPPPGSC